MNNITVSVIFYHYGVIDLELDMIQGLDRITRMHVNVGRESRCREDIVLIADS